MSAPAPILLFELNEVPFRVLDDFVRREPKSTLASVMRNAAQIASNSRDQVQLDPWISWPTLHRGVNADQHGLLHLGQKLDRVDRELPPIWRLLADAGVSVGVFGSIHSNNVPDNVGDYAFYAPDFFADEVFAHPAHLEPFQRFNLGMTRRSARNVQKGVPGDLLLNFVRAYPKLGISLDTVASVFDQLVTERKNPKLKLRRRSLQSLLMIDVFLELQRKTQPQFSTFYTNHVAAAMHRYWAAAFPEDYDTRTMPDQWVADYRDEIHQAMSVFDRMLAKVKRWADASGTIVLIATSLGQGAVEHNRAEHFATITDLERFMTAIGFDRSDYKQRPAMSPCLGVVVAPDRLEELMSRLGQVSVSGFGFIKTHNTVEPMSYGVEDDGFVSLFTNFENYEGPPEVQIGNRTLSFAEAGWGLGQHEDSVGVSAYHTPDGVLLVYDPKNPKGDASRRPTSTTEIAPAVLAHFGVGAPSYMAEPSGVITAALEAGAPAQKVTA